MGVRREVSASRTVKGPKGRTINEENMHDDGDSVVIIDSNDMEDVKLDEVFGNFYIYAKRYSSVEAALNDLPAFVSEMYSGKNIEGFKSFLRENYDTISDILMDKYREEYAKRVLQMLL